MSIQKNLDLAHMTASDSRLYELIFGHAYDNFIEMLRILIVLRITLINKD